tara:strand:+ start:1219 stop:1452 length:234 start_codon:yes stop_codon:yes gene_type:complete
MSLSTLSQIEKKINKLSQEEKLLLLERMGNKLSESNVKDKDKEKLLIEMAADPEIQRELQQIDKEFAATEKDGLGKV